MQRRVGSRVFSSVLALVLCGVMVFGSALPAFAELEGEARYESETNPSVGPNRTSKRWGWGNTFLPHLKVTTIPEDGPKDELLETTGFLYEAYQVDQSGLPTRAPVWGASLNSPDPEGTVIDMRFDLRRAMARWGYDDTLPGVTLPGEGMYAFTNRFYNQFRVENVEAADTLLFGLDFTNPDPVVDLTGTVGWFPSANGGWTEQTTRDLRWTRQAYDKLSGVAGYYVSVDSTEVAFAQNVGPHPAYEPYAALLAGDLVSEDYLNNVTVENIPAGAHKLSVVVEDRATNRSAARSIMAYVDPDTPKLSVTIPAADNALVGVKPTFTVKATDEAGISKVKYYVDGNLVGTATSAPWSCTADLSALPAGTHTLKVEAEDKIGSAPGSWWVPHVATVTRTIRIDKTSPVVSSVSGAPTPFYPRKRDGYRDNFIVRFRSSETATAKLTIKDSSGKVWRTVTKSVPAGSSYVVWNGRSDSNTMKSGTFKWYLQLSDAAGNKSATKSGTVSLKYYQIVYSGGGARIIQR